MTIKSDLIERCARIAERDVVWADREDAKLKSWSPTNDVFTLPAGGIPWDQVDRWAYVVGIVAGQNIAAQIRSELLTQEEGTPS